MLTAFHPVAPSGESPLSMELDWWALEALWLLLPRGTNRRKLSYLMQKPSGNSSFSPSTALTWAVVTRKTQSLHPNARKGKAVGSGLHASRGLEVHFFLDSVPASSMFIRALGTWFTWFASLVGFFSPQTNIKDSHVLSNPRIRQEGGACECFGKWTLLGVAHN